MPAFNTPEALAEAAKEYYETPFSERVVYRYTNKQKTAMRNYMDKYMGGGKRYTTHKQRKHKSRKSRKGRKSQKRRRS